VKSLAAYALRRAGVGFIAGFGDSVGDELRVNMVDLLGGSLEWTPKVGGLTCHNNKNRIHKLKSEVNNRNLLVECIASMVEGLPKTQPLLLPTELVNSSSANSLSGNDSHNIINEVPITTVVLVTNFMCQHSVWTNTLDEIETLLKLQAQQHAQLAEKLLREYNLNYRRIFYAVS